MRPTFPAQYRAVHVPVTGYGADTPVPSPAQSGEPGRRLILISYHFPPSSAVGALRWQKLARFAEQRGFGLDVITLDPQQLPSSAPERLDDVPSTTRVYGVPHHPGLAEAIEGSLLQARRGLHALRSGTRRDSSAGSDSPDQPRQSQAGSIAKMDIGWWPLNASFMRRAFLVTMDVMKMHAWAVDAFRLARRVYERDAHRAVITCGPPQMAHEAGRRLSRVTGLPHVVDLRDPWSLLERLLEPVASPLFYVYHRRFERRVMRNAALVVSNTKPARDALTALYPETVNRQITVLNGYDDERIEVPAREKFLIAYAGSIYLDRDPRPFFVAAARAIRQLGLAPEDFGIHFMGNVATLDGKSIGAMAEEVGIGSFFIADPPKRRSEALRCLARASILLSLPQDCELAIPSKVYEYMLFPSWILALAEPESATAQLLRGREADVVSHTDIDGMTEVICRRYREFATGITPPRLADEPSLGRAAQAQILFSAIERVLDDTSGMPRQRRTTSAERTA